MIHARVEGDSMKNPFCFIFNPLRCWHIAIHTNSGEKLRRSVETRIFMVHQRIFDALVKTIETSDILGNLSAPSRALWLEFKADEPSFNPQVHENYSQRKGIALKQRDGWPELNTAAKKSLAQDVKLLDAWKFMFSDPSLMFEAKLTRTDVNSTGEQWISPHGETIFSTDFQVQSLDGSKTSLPFLPKQGVIAST